MAKVDREKRLEILRLVKAIAGKKEEIEVARDELRELVDNINSLCETIDEGIETLEIGLGNFREALEEMSQYL